MNECDKASTNRVTRPVLPDSGVAWEGISWKDFGWFEFRCIQCRIPLQLNYKMVPDVCWVYGVEEGGVGGLEVMLFLCCSIKYGTT